MHNESPTFFLLFHTLTIVIRIRTKAHTVLHSHLYNIQKALFFFQISRWRRSRPRRRSLSASLASLSMVDASSQATATQLTSDRGNQPRIEPSPRPAYQLSADSGYQSTLQCNVHTKH
uniref:(northern house mosquito) hypothetical protein n=1 Tax=Culex pipiens TaxID=7175 RepID=A0A8D8AIM2_CULPI